MDRALIYKIESKADGKVYIGSTINLKNRWKCHLYGLRSKTHHSSHMQYAWNKYGEDNFSIGVIDECDVVDRETVEQKWIDKLNSFDQKYGYNICPIAGSVRCKPHKAETREKIRLAHKGKKHSPIHVARGVESRKGYIASEETRKKLSLAGKGRVFSRESIQKSVNARAGFRHSTATKKLLSELATGRVVSVETREKIAKSGIGGKWTDSQREKMLRIQRNEVTEEQRRNISKARGGRAFTVFGPDGVAHEFQTLSEAANRFGLDASNIHKCLIGKAKQTKGYTCQYVNPQAA